MITNADPVTGKNGTYATSCHGGSLTINDGKFTGGQDTAIQSETSNSSRTVIINGGDFYLDKGQVMTAECGWGSAHESQMTTATKDALYGNMVMFNQTSGASKENAPIINGGTFHFFNPGATNKNTGTGNSKGFSYLGTKATCTESNGVYTVKS